MLTPPLGRMLDESADQAESFGRRMLQKIKEGPRAGRRPHIKMIVRSKWAIPIAAGMPIIRIVFFDDRPDREHRAYGECGAEAARPRCADRRPAPTDLRSGRAIQTRDEQPRY